MRAVHGTVISFRDILLNVSRPLVSSIVAGGLAFGVRVVFGQLLSPLPRLVREKHPSSSCVPWDAPVRHRTEVTLPGSPSRIEGALIN
jgi:hypothetical protein